MKPFISNTSTVMYFISNPRLTTITSLLTRTLHIIKESVFTGHRIFVQIIVTLIMLIIIIIRMVGITFMAHQ